MPITAFVFPGQGSQSIGMLNSLANRYPLIIELFETVSERMGYDVWHLVQHGPDALLNQTMHTQVAVLTANVAVFTLLKQQMAIRAKIMAGHSLGEYAALVCAGSISLPDAAELVAKRGQLMQETVPLGVGSMAAIVGLTNEQVLSLCEQVSTTTQYVSPANYNAIGQVVIAGHTDAVKHAIILAEEMDARLAKVLPVSVPCHCNLLTQAADLFADELLNTKFNIPELPVISNVDLSIYKSVDQIRALLKEQLYRPVRWVETIQRMKIDGVELIVECGPGKVLTGLVKRIDKTLDAISINDPPSLLSALSRVLMT